MKEFYIYLHCKPDGTPFYVGKGTGARCAQMGSMRTLHHRNVTNKYGENNIKIFVFPSESEEDALREEMQAIANLRRDGVELVNLTNGGDGSSGMRHTAETRKKMSAAHAGNAFFEGKKHSAKSREKISLSLRQAYLEKPRARSAEPYKERTCKKCGVIFAVPKCTNCARINNARYRLENFDRLKAEAKRRYIESPEVWKATKSKYYQKNKEKIIMDSKKWGLNNPARIKEITKKYRTKSLADK